MNSTNSKSSLATSLVNQTKTQGVSTVGELARVSIQRERVDFREREESLCDPLTDHYMVTPIVCSDSQTYDRATLDVLKFQSRHLSVGLRSPYTRLPLSPAGIDWVMLYKTRSIPSVKARLEPFRILESRSLFDLALDEAEAWVRRCCTQKIGSTLFILAWSELRDRGWLLIPEVLLSLSEAISEQLKACTAGRHDAAILIPMRLACTRLAERFSDDTASEIKELMGLMCKNEDERSRGEIIYHLIKAAKTSGDEASLETNACGLMAIEALLPWLELEEEANWDLSYFSTEEIHWIKRFDEFGLKYTSRHGWKIFLQKILSWISLSSFSEMMDKEQKKDLVNLQERYDRFGIIMICDTWDWLHASNLA